MSLHWLYGAIGEAANANVSSMSTSDLSFASVFLGWAFFVANFGVLYWKRVQDWISLF